MFMIALLLTVNFAVMAERKGGTLTIASGQNFIDINPMIADSAYDVYVINQIYDELITYSPDTLKPMPCVAESWEFSEDQSEITFYIREGINFTTEKN